jgi:DNA mismatch endonuclease (patch repair protein)
MDTLSVEERSERMARIRSKDTKPEMALRSLVHRLGYRFRLHRKDLAGSPDLVFPGAKKAIFMHGCFWHGHEGCKIANRPKTRRDFWDEKFRRNKERDLLNEATLKAAGWDVATIWECEIKNSDLIAKRIVRFLSQETKSAKRSRRHG